MSTPAADRPPSPARRRALLGGGALVASAGLADLWRYLRGTDGLEPPDGRPRMQGPAPVLFIGHGSPLNVLRDSPYTRALRRTGRELGLPRAVLVISAHWQTPGETAVSVDARHATLHDFGGLDAALFAQRYPAPGAPALARTLAQRLGEGAGPGGPARDGAAPDRAVSLHGGRGLDHGAWTVLHHLYPAADVPVFELSLDVSRDAAAHLATGRALAALRGEGVLILASGNLVHNLDRTMDTAAPSAHGLQPWAEDFDQRVKAALLAGDVAELLRWPRWGEAARQAVPTPDHWYPLFHALGAVQAGEAPRWIHEGFEEGTISMRCVRWG